MWTLLYYSRTLRSGQIVRPSLWHLSLLLTLSISAATQTIVPNPDDPLPTTVVLRDDASEVPLARQERILSATRDALTLLAQWIGPYPARQLGVTMSARGDGRREPSPDLIVISSPWISPERDVTTERSVITAVARAYFTPPGTYEPAGEFAAGMAEYVAARAINQLLEGRHAFTYWWFGEFVPYVVRSVPLSRSRRDMRPMFRSIFETDADGMHGARVPDALQTFERFIGWPAMQQALSEFATVVRSGRSAPEDFAAIVTRQRGQDVWWFFEQALRPDARFDYGVANLTTAPGRTDGTFETVVSVRRYGDAFANVDRLADIVTRFADGTEIRERWDSLADEVSFSYVSRSPAVAAAVDERAVFLLDDNRMNNVRALQTPFSPLVARVTLNWMIWLQNLALTCAALV